MNPSMKLSSYSLSVSGGSGLVSRSKASLSVAGGSDEDAGRIIAFLKTAIDDSGPEGIDPDLIAAEIARQSQVLGQTASFAAVVETIDGVDVFVQGSAQVRTEFDEMISGPALTRRTFSNVGALWIGLTDPPAVPAHRVVNLELGVVPGSGAVLYMPDGSNEAASSGDSSTSGTSDPTLPGQSSGAADQGSARAAVQPLPPPPAATNRDAPNIVEPFEAIDWTGGDNEQRTSLPIAGVGKADVTLQRQREGEEVLGIHCSRGHFNNPLAGYCQVCGISMVHLTHRLVPGVRPTLGFIVFGDGTTYALDRSYVIGRRPSSRSNGATPLVVSDPFASISREHASLELSNWDVVYTDLGSTNGSFSWSPETQRWLPLQAGQGRVLQSGDSISVGRSAFTFEGAAREISA